MPTWPSPRSEQLGTPNPPRSPFHAGQVFRGFPIYAFATAYQVARSPVRIRPIRSALESFYFQASNRSVALPVAGYDYNSDWTPLLAGLSPAGMASRLAPPDPDVTLSRHPARATARRLPPSAEPSGSSRFDPVGPSSTAMTRPLRSTGITPLHHYYGAVRPSPAHRYFRPRGWSRLRLFPWHRRPGSHVPYKSQIELRAAYMPDAAWAVSVHPPSLSRKVGQPPVLTSPNPILTLPKRFACARLSQSYLPESCSGFSATFTTMAFDH